MGDAGEPGGRLPGGGAPPPDVPARTPTGGGVYVGLMSGTSLDGISAAVVRFTPRGDPVAPPERSTHRAHAAIPQERAKRASVGSGYDAELLGFHVHEYTAEQRDRLHAAMREGSARDYCRLAADLGGWLADAAVRVMADAGVGRPEVRAIGSHGQTLWHEPGHSTWQLDAPAVIAERTGHTVVSDFRTRDVAAGGQGAPLVPIADALLFAGEGWRALQNIGGIGNVTIVPPDATLASVRAFDTGPGVRVIDAVVQGIDPARRYDEDGRMAAAGTAARPVVDQLLAEPYFAMEPPKSTGRELFDARYVERLVQLVRAHDPRATDEDLVATATALTAASIADAYRRFIPEPVEEVLVSGGGARNRTLCRMIQQAIAPVVVRQFDERYFDGEAKEAVAFALLAHLHLEGLHGNVPTATGARGGRILGSLTPG
ncbi:MAG: Anhydro-N-acetylmuramic acid kinase [Gemmatimonadetes bacterium]|nr:Anhydro-N-acetylmuramic acid kinase [Gemmatimonadota bacterium]